MNETCPRCGSTTAFRDAGSGTCEEARECDARLRARSASVLDEAAVLVYGDRQEAYGDAHETFSRIALIWEAVLGTPVTPIQVACCMVGLKMARLFASPLHRDSVVDIAGYAACLGDLQKAAASE
jgi:hypothetical protein